MPNNTECVIDEQCVINGSLSFEESGSNTLLTFTTINDGELLQRSGTNIISTVAVTGPTGSQGPTGNQGVTGPTGTGPLSTVLVVGNASSGTNLIMTAGDTLTTNRIDSTTATTMQIGDTTATKIEVGATGMNTEVQGSLNIKDDVTITSTNDPSKMTIITTTTGGDACILLQNPEENITLGLAGGNTGAFTVTQATTLNTIKLMILDQELVAIGRNAGGNIDLSAGNALNNILIGNNAGVNITTGHHNTIVGDQAGDALNTTNNVIIGRRASSAQTSGANTVVGTDAARLGTTFDNCTIMGCNAGENVNANNNTLLGHRCGDSLNSGGNNTAVGSITLFDESSGENNTVMGYLAAANQTGASENCVFGTEAGEINISGTRLAFFGFRAGENSTTSDNSFFGHQAGEQVTSGQYNTFMGSNAGATVTTEANNTVIGAGADVSASVANSVALGRNATATTSNTVQLGDSNVTLVNTSGSITSAGTSDNSFSGNILASKDITVGPTGTVTIHQAASSDSLIFDEEGGSNLTTTMKNDGVNFSILHEGFLSQNTELKLGSITGGEQLEFRSDSVFSAPFGFTIHNEDTTNDATVLELQNQHGTWSFQNDTIGDLIIGGTHTNATITIDESADDVVIDADTTTITAANTSTDTEFVVAANTSTNDSIIRMEANGQNWQILNDRSADTFSINPTIGGNWISVDRNNTDRSTEIQGPETKVSNDAEVTLVVSTASNSFDSKVIWTIDDESSAVSWSAGIDNSDSDNWKVASGTGVGTNTALSIDISDHSVLFAGGGSTSTDNGPNMQIIHGVDVNSSVTAISTAAGAVTVWSLNTTTGDSYAVKLTIYGRGATTGDIFTVFKNFGITNKSGTASIQNGGTEDIVETNTGDLAVTTSVSTSTFNVLVENLTDATASTDETINFRATAEVFQIDF